VNRRSRSGRTGDRGSASLWLLGLGLALLVLAVTVAMAGGLLVARHRAQTAADLGALAGARHAAESADVACATAGHVVRENGARLVDCHVEVLDVVVTAEVETPGRWGGARASARAGPLRAPA